MPVFLPFFHSFFFVSFFSFLHFLLLFSGSVPPFGGKRGDPVPPFATGLLCSFVNNERSWNVYPSIFKLIKILKVKKTYSGRTLGTPNIRIERRTKTYSGRTLGTPNIRIVWRTKIYLGRTLGTPNIRIERRTYIKSVF